MTSPPGRRNDSHLFHKDTTAVRPDGPSHQKEVRECLLVFSPFLLSWRGSCPRRSWRPVASAEVRLVVPTFPKGVVSTPRDSCLTVSGREAGSCRGRVQGSSSISKVREAGTGEDRPCTRVRGTVSEGCVGSRVSRTLRLPLFYPTQVSSLRSPDFKSE